MSWHVDYWDYLGWKDPWGSAAATARQRRYAAAWKVGSIYTPCVVVAGRDMRGGIDEAIRVEAAKAPRIAIRAGSAPLVAAEAAVSGELALAAIPDAVLPEGAQVIFVLLQRAAVTDCRAGENHGRTLRDYMIALGTSAPLKAAAGAFAVALPRPAGVAPADLAVAAIVEDPAAMQPIECRLFDVVAPAAK